MVRSMTGYGKATGEYGLKKITVEIRSLNSKQLDLNLRLPQLYKEKEHEIRNWAGKEIARGRADILVFVEGGAEDATYSIAEGQFHRYYSELESLSNKVGSAADLLPVVMRLPEVIRMKQENLSEEEWNVLLRVFGEAGKRFNEFREKEGSALAEDLLLRTSNIESLLTGVEELEPGRKENIRTRLKTSLEENKISTSGNDRYEQEIIFYLEKLDITEEKVRLLTHCKYFRETIETPESEGRKLGFIAQEMGREINTIGSKANDAGMQRLVVQMKDELEKIREQVNNVL